MYGPDETDADGIRAQTTFRKRRGSGAHAEQHKVSVQVRRIPHNTYEGRVASSVA
jgi:hypothetical protein